MPGFNLRILEKKFVALEAKERFVEERYHRRPRTAGGKLAQDVQPRASTPLGDFRKGCRATTAVLSESTAAQGHLQKQYTTSSNAMRHRVAEALEDQRSRLSRARDEIHREDAAMQNRQHYSRIPEDPAGDFAPLFEGDVSEDDAPTASPSRTSEPHLAAGSRGANFGGTSTPDRPERSRTAPSPTLQNEGRSSDGAWTPTLPAAASGLREGRLSSAARRRTRHSTVAAVGSPAPSPSSRVGGTKGSSRFANPHPLHIPSRPMTAPTVPEQGRAVRESVFHGMALLRNILAPGIGLPLPRAPTKFDPRRHSRLSPNALRCGAGPDAGDHPAGEAGTVDGYTAAVAAMESLRPPSDTVGRPPLPLHRSLGDIPPAALHKDFYYLHIRVVHSLPLRNWVFTVILSDISPTSDDVNREAQSPRQHHTQQEVPALEPNTPTQRLPSVVGIAGGQLPAVNSPSAMRSDVPRSEVKYQHTIRGLRVNEHKYLIFHPPTSTTLSPVDDIPWVPSPSFLFGRTFRLEVFATAPSKTKVIDTTIHYGLS